VHDYILNTTTRLTFTSTKYRPMGEAGLCYVPTRKWLRNKHCCINVKNPNDYYCFKWVMLSALFPAEQHSYRLSNYIEYRDTLNLNVANLTQNLLV